METLPNDILLRILSHGTTKEAVSTSLISRRFTNLWKYMERFEFRGNLQNHALLNAFLNDTFLREFMAPDLKSFLLTLVRGEYNPNDIIAWIEFVLSRNVNNVYLDCRVKGLRVPLPISLFNCNSLKHLHLEGRSNVVIVPGNGSLPLLNRLHLVNVQNLSAESLQNILNISPALKYFRLDCFTNVKEPKEYTVFSNSVEKLFIDYGGLIEKIHVNTPSLKIMGLNNDVGLYSFPEITFENMPNLEQARAILGDVQLTSFISSITSVRKLTLCSTVGIRYPHRNFMLINLEELEVCSCNICKVDLYDLLKASPNVKVLNFFEFVGHPDNERHSPIRQNFAVPQTTLNNLQFLTWSNFTCSPRSMHILNELLAYGTGLQNVEIEFNDDVTNAENWKKKILDISRASVDCHIEVLCDEFPDLF